MGSASGGDLQPNERLQHRDAGAVFDDLYVETILILEDGCRALRVIKRRFQALHLFVILIADDERVIIAEPGLGHIDGRRLGAQRHIDRGAAAQYVAHRDLDAALSRDRGTLGA